LKKIFLFDQALFLQHVKFLSCHLPFGFSFLFKKNPRKSAQNSGFSKQVGKNFLMNYEKLKERMKKFFLFFRHLQNFSLCNKNFSEGI